MDDHNHSDLPREDTLEVPEPVTLQLRRAGSAVRVVTDRPPPVRTHRPRKPVVVKVR